MVNGRKINFFAKLFLAYKVMVQSNEFENVCCHLFFVTELESSD